MKDLSIVKFKLSRVCSFYMVYVRVDWIGRLGKVTIGEGGPRWNVFIVGV